MIHLIATGSSCGEYATLATVDDGQEVMKTYDYIDITFTFKATIFISVLLKHNYMKYLFCLFMLFVSFGSYCQDQASSKDYTRSNCQYQPGLMDYTCPFDYVSFYWYVAHSEFYNRKMRDSVFSTCYDDLGYYVNVAKKADVRYIMMRVVDKEYTYLAHNRLIAVVTLERELKKQNELRTLQNSAMP